ncbi:hypothetical protein AB6A40_006196 [Gnathostoma spinigerum]|uniref:Uncharacterized protein n=1 Tax=Gnathostoma spinigerum TaxID=75299 RepID=A0ABD6ES13_9BILA
MGLPMIQVFMIAAKQISRPVADYVLRYGKDHPMFRNGLLIPLGRALARLSTRLRMKYLGLGKPLTLASVSEATALEQASEFVQQLVLFSYSVCVFAAYYAYTKKTAPEYVSAASFNEFKETTEEQLRSLERHIEELRCLLVIDQTPPYRRRHCLQEQQAYDGPKHLSSSVRRHDCPKISSLPIDEAERIVLSGAEQFIVTRRGRSVCIEPLYSVIMSDKHYEFRKS